MTLAENGGAGHKAENGRPDLPGEVDSSPLDNRRYRALTLAKNGLKVLLVSDLESDNAAAAMDVSVGHFSDPDNLPGLAHFCEHMLFLGTEKYPEEDSYRQFLAENGGQSNAYTSMENTNYHFQVVSKGFREALDRFAQFFTAPLFTDSATERELQAVDSEAQKNLQSDAHRIFQLHKSFASAKHPYHKFGTGNKKTLWDDAREQGLDVRSALLQFHEEYYSANMMHLTIVAPEALDTLEQLVVELFSDVRNKERKPPSADYASIEPFDDLKQIVYVPPIKDLRMLDLLWLLPPFQTQYRTKPCHYIAHLLGHEGKNSLLSLLKARGWADGLSAGHGKSTDTFSTFEVNIQLTVDGENCTDEIIELIFGYLRLIREEGIQPRIFEECRAVAEMTFRFQEREEPLQLATRLSADMRHYPEQHYLTGPNIFYEFDPEAVLEMCSRLTADAVWICSISKMHEGQTDSTEKWYGTPYRLELIDEDKRKAWATTLTNDELHIPEPNVFIPTDFSVLAAPAEPGLYPEVIRDDDRFRIHFLQDRVFERPKANLYFEVMTPVAYFSPRHTVLANLFTMLLSDDLNEYAYSAEIAGLYYGIRTVQTGMRISFQGFSHRLEKLVAAILQRIGTFQMKQKRFEFIKDALKRDYANFFKEQPYQHAMYSKYFCLEAPRWHILDYLANIDSVTFGEVEAFAPLLTKSMFVEALVHGNVDKENALAFARIFEDSCAFQALSPAEFVHSRIAELPRGEEGHLYRLPGPNENNNNSAILVYFQVGVVKPSDRRTAVVAELYAEVLRKPSFHQLRTVEQLGYIVSSGVSKLENVHGIRFIVQSTVMDPDSLNDRIEAFLIFFRDDVLAQLTNEEFRKYVESLKTIKRDKEKRLTQVTNRFWSEIRARTYQYDRREQEAIALNDVKKQDLLDFHDRVIAAKGSDRRKLSIHVYGSEHPIDAVKETTSALIKDPLAFKQSLPLLPVSGGPYPDRHITKESP